MKKAIALTLALAAGIGVAACGSTSNSTSSANIKAKATKTVTAKSAAATTSRPAVSAKAQATCIKFIADGGSGYNGDSIGWFTKLAKDAMPLIGNVPTGDDTTVFAFVGDVEKALSAVASNNSAALSAIPMKGDTAQLMALCQTVTTSPTSGS